MSMTVTRTEGVTVLTVTSNPKSSCPLLCQILGSLCCSQACSVSQRLRGRLGGTQSALGTAQIMIGLLNIGVGTTIGVSRRAYSPLVDSMACYWLGIMFVVCGVMCVLAEKFPSACLVVITGLMNFMLSAATAVVAVVLYSIDIATRMESYIGCDGHDDYDYDPTATPQPPSLNVDICKKYRAYSKFLWRGLDISMLIFAVLQLAIAISAGVLAFKAVCKKDASVHDPELNKPLVDEVLSCPAV